MCICVCVNGVVGMCIWGLAGLPLEPLSLRRLALSLAQGLLLTPGLPPFSFLFAGKSWGVGAAGLQSSEEWGAGGRWCW